MKKTGDRIEYNRVELFEFPDFYTSIKEKLTLHQIILLKAEIKESTFLLDMITFDEKTLLGFHMHIDNNIGVKL